MIWHFSSEQPALTGWSEALFAILRDDALQTGVWTLIAVFVGWLLTRLSSQAQERGLQRENVRLLLARVEALRQRLETEQKEGFQGRYPAALEVLSSRGFGNLHLEVMTSVLAFYEDLSRLDALYLSSIQARQDKRTSVRSEIQDQAKQVRASALKSLDAVKEALRCREMRSLKKGDLMGV